MNEKLKLKLSKILLLSLKIGIGASAAYFVAEALGLDFASSAGIITLLTLQTTKWETFRLSIRRLLTFFFTFGLCWTLYYVLHTSWIDYGIYLFFLVFLCEFLGWRSAISVNAVIATHFLSTHNFTMEFMMNELLLVVIGIAIAIVLNLFHINSAHEIGIIKSMRHVEHQMKQILIELSGYLKHKSMGQHVWDDIVKLEDELGKFLDMAHEYQNNTFVSHPEYYINYFRMRREQCGALHNLHKEMRRISNLPKQAEIVSDYILNMCQHVTEMNDPQKQIAQLEEVTDNMKNQPLPETTEEFESRALLYHVLMELEDFLLYKKRFVESIDEDQFRVYWKREIEGK